MKHLFRTRFLSLALLLCLAVAAPAEEPLVTQHASGAISFPIDGLEFIYTPPEGYCLPPGSLQAYLHDFESVSPLAKPWLLLQPCPEATIPHHLNEHIWIQSPIQALGRDVGERQNALDYLEASLRKEMEGQSVITEESGDPGRLIDMGYTAREIYRDDVPVYHIKLVPMTDGTNAFDQFTVVGRTAIAGKIIAYCRYGTRPEGMAQAELVAPVRDDLMRLIEQNPNPPGDRGEPIELSNEAPSSFKLRYVIEALAFGFLFGFVYDRWKRARSGSKVTA